MNIKIGSSALSRNAKLGNQVNKQTALYRIRHVISESELAIVYSARDDKQGKKYIIKEFFPKAFFYRDKNASKVKRRAKYAPEKYEMLRQAFLEECEAWGFQVFPIARQDEQLYVGEQVLFPFEKDMSELDFFDGMK